jgi:hypothetical protein
MSEVKTTLDDLNNDLSLLDTASDKVILVLNDEANSNPDFPLAGPVRYLLNARANSIRALSETTEDK